MLASDLVFSINVMLPNPIGVPFGKRFGAVCVAESLVALQSPSMSNTQPAQPRRCLPRCSLDGPRRSGEHRRGKKGCFVRILSRAGIADIPADIATAPAVN